MRTGMLTFPPWTPSRSVPAGLRTSRWPGRLLCWRCRRPTPCHPLSPLWGWLPSCRELVGACALAHVRACVCVCACICVCIRVCFPPGGAAQRACSWGRAQHHQLPQLHDQAPKVAPLNCAPCAHVRPPTRRRRYPALSQLPLSSRPQEAFALARVVSHQDERNCVLVAHDLEALPLQQEQAGAQGGGGDEPGGVVLLFREPWGCTISNAGPGSMLFKTGPGILL